MRGELAVKDADEGGESPGLHNRRAEGRGYPRRSRKGILYGDGGVSPLKKATSGSDSDIAHSSR